MNEKYGSCGTSVSGKRGELHGPLAKFTDLSHDLVDGSLAAIEDRAQLHRGRFHNSHRNLLIPVSFMTG